MEMDLEKLSRDYKYMLIAANDGSFPVIVFSNALEALNECLSYVQHFLIKDTRTGETIKEL